MEMPGRRSNYALLSQNPDEQFNPQPPPKQPKVAVGFGLAQQPLYYESHSGEKNKLKSDRAAAFDWDVIDQRMIQAQGHPQQSRIATAPFLGSFGLQKQSSGSSFGESSISGDYYVPSLSNNDVGISNLSDGAGEFRAKATEVSSTCGGGSSSSKSWAQQTEESYQLQLALALRLSSEATCADDPNFLDPVPDEAASVASSSPASAEAISHRYWVTLQKKKLQLNCFSALLYYHFFWYYLPDANLSITEVPENICFKKKECYCEFQEMLVYERKKIVVWMCLSLVLWEG